MGNTQFTPLIEFRDWLKEIRNQPEYRQIHRRNGLFTIKNGKHIPGPFTIAARQMILEKLLAVQAAHGEVLISNTEIQLIKNIWANDILDTNNQRKSA